MSTAQPSKLNYLQDGILQSVGLGCGDGGCVEVGSGGGVGEGLSQAGELQGVADGLFGGVAVMCGVWVGCGVPQAGALQGVAVGLPGGSVGRGKGVDVAGGVPQDGVLQGVLVVGGGDVAVDGGGEVG